MQPSIRTFRASTMEDAMALVRQELGPDAIVLESKEVGRKRLLPWSASRNEVEISAERQIPCQDSESVKSNHQRLPATNRAVRTLAESQALGATMELFAKIPELPKDVFQQQIKKENQAGPKLRSSSFDQADETQIPIAPNYAKSLQSLETLVEQLERRARPRGLVDVPAELFQYYLQLVNTDVDDEIARELIASLHQNRVSDVAHSPASVTAMLTVLIERELRCAPPIHPKPGRREIVTVVGPTGVGKTTTIAKFAAHFHLRLGLRVGLITVDTYRVGAVDQLRSYAEILQVPLRTAANPEELRNAIDQTDNVDVIFIDTAGRSPFDEPKMKALREILQPAASDHVLLVASAASGPQMISKIADQFASACPTSLVLTKLDEVHACGGLLSVAREVAHPVSYLATGQDVPDDFEPAHPNRLARLVLGIDAIHRTELC